MSTAIVKAGRATAGALIVADVLDQEAQQRALLGQYVAHHMTEGTDYGVIPGTKNRTLLKPGAEKLTQLFRCIPRFVVEDKIENWETGHFHYRFSCQIVTQADGAVVAEGVGSCSTYESRYRWRNADRKCPSCGKAAIIKGKAEYGGGWLCFKKKDGCGAKFDDGDQAVEGQSAGRVQNPDIIDCVNTVLKIAKKRALVDAAIALARCSDIFTQDVEDFADAHPVAAAPAPTPAPTPAPKAEPVHPDQLDMHRDDIFATRSLAELLEVWNSIPGAAKVHLVADKDKQKSALSLPASGGGSQQLFDAPTDGLPPAH
jgi:hypothetical protein